ncbi:Peptidyl-prolyl cis-trans isomerase CWC27 like protein [Eufriesea mexicana]|uniref:Peptidyl-prolyl cis-trans isomerase n=1 Tax=Eufriesea mexicana TaxID=516756 RepID=A0A310SGY6_9HYME|nr:Peptidyl-prolyl cis-trans isomerase CWC27 like protein [Eufriesea mexicana]
MRIIEDMENEQLIIVMKGKVKLNIECKCCIKAKCVEISIGQKYAVAHRGLHWANIANVKRRVVKGFLTQDGVSTGTGEGGKIYGEPFKDEFHRRLRFCYRDLIAMANAGKDDNGSKFFFTLSCTPELQNKHTIYGEVTGESIYSMHKLEEVLIDEFSGEGKSAHDHLSDSRLRSQPAVEPHELAIKKKRKVVAIRKVTTK